MRLQKRKILSQYEELENLKMKLWNQILETIIIKETPNWTLQDLEKALKMLKNKKCRDPNGMYNEVFKENYAGRDLKEALLKLYNGIKQSKEFPNFMCLSDICSIQKKKGSLFSLENQRGISLITVFKKC